MATFRRRLLTAAASALTLQFTTAHADAASAAPPLRALHEALLTGSAGRRYAKAAPVGESLWELSFGVQDLRTKARAAQSQLVD